MKAARDCGRWRETLNLLTEALAAGIEPNYVHFCAAVNACIIAGRAQECAFMLKTMANAGMPAATTLYNRYIACYFRQRERGLSPQFTPYPLLVFVHVFSKR